MSLLFCYEVFRPRKSIVSASLQQHPVGKAGKRSKRLSRDFSVCSKQHCATHAFRRPQGRKNSCRFQVKWFTHLTKV